MLAKSPFRGPHGPGPALSGPHGPRAHVSLHSLVPSLQPQSSEALPSLLLGTDPAADSPVPLRPLPADSTPTLVPTSVLQRPISWLTPCQALYPHSAPAGVAESQESDNTKCG